MEAIANRFRYEQKPTRNLVSLLDALAVHLQTHFEFEESDGYFSGLAQKTPHVSATVERLLREHEAILEEVDKLVTMTREAFATAHDTSDLAKRFSRFHTQLVNHEHEENKLIQDVYNVDIGTTD
ncbi:MAG: hemerythrin domain-containing protein [Planctomycetes bacterium]|nr:hemerythrin domain-containing protein [Planctomycetota bacterium]